jgi:hypothetical protein
MLLPRAGHPGATSNCHASLSYSRIAEMHRNGPCGREAAGGMARYGSPALTVRVVVTSDVPVSPTRNLTPTVSPPPGRGCTDSGTGTEPCDGAESLTAEQVTQGRGGDGGARSSGHR